MLLLCGLCGCGSSTPAGGGDAAAPDASSADAAPPIDAPPPPPPTIRFIAIGDTGEGNEAQYQVGEAMRQTCAVSGCDFVLMLGDNIYDDGVSSLEDTQWQTKFEEPYRGLDVPFYVALGNHDYGGQLVFDIPGLGNEWDKGPIEVAYSEISSKWTMPATFYTFRRAHVAFIVLDTNSIMWDNIDHGDQRLWYQFALEEVAGADWVIAAGHHPYLSNGSHGNAGSYESIEVGGVEIPNPVDLLNGASVKRFFDDEVCGTVDMYLAGHDHNRQWLDAGDALCGTELIVSGAGAKLRDFRDRGNPYHWQDDTTEGFLYVVIEGDTFTGQFIDKNGQVNFERSYTRRSRQPQ